LLSLKTSSLIARLVVEGFIIGLHRSPYHGFSVEFASIANTPGDEIRNIDWKAFARTDKYYVKQFEEETNLRCVIALMQVLLWNMRQRDKSPNTSMAVTLRHPAYLLIKQRDAVVLPCTIQPSYLPATPLKTILYKWILRVIDTTQPSNEQKQQSLSMYLPKELQGEDSSLSSVISSQSASVTKALSHFRHKKHEVLAFQVLDRGNWFQIWQGGNFQRYCDKWRDGYTALPDSKIILKSNERFYYRIKTWLPKQHIDYHLTDTSEPFDKALRNI